MHEDAIPVFDAVGCDVCPGLCQIHDLSLIPVTELVRRFRHHAAENVREEPDGSGATAHWEQLERLACIAMRISNHAERQLVALLDDPDDGVRFSTAWITIIFGLDAATVAAANVMHELASTDLPLAYTAHVVRRIWELDAASKHPVLPGRGNRPWRMPRPVGAQAATPASIRATPRTRAAATTARPSPPGAAGR